MLEQYEKEGPTSKQEKADAKASAASPTEESIPASAKTIAKAPAALSKEEFATVTAEVAKQGGSADSKAVLPHPHQLQSCR